MKNYAIINGIITDMDDVKEVEFPNAKVKMTNILVQCGTTIIPIQVWGENKVDFCKAHMNTMADFLCTVVGNQSVYTNRDGEEKKISQAILRMSKMILETYTSDF